MKMKMKKFFVPLILTAAAALSGCSTEANQFMFEGLLGGICSFGADGASVRRTEIARDKAKSVGKCFDSIQLCGAELTLPMKVSDMPDIFELKYDTEKTPVSFYSGLNMSTIGINYGGKLAGYGEAIYPAGKKPEDGQFVSLCLFNDFVASMGDDLKNTMTYEQFEEAFGCETPPEALEEASYLMYTLHGKKSITIDRTFASGETPTMVYLSVYPEFPQMTFSALASWNELTSEFTVSDFIDFFMGRKE